MNITKAQAKQRIKEQAPDWHLVMVDNKDQIVEIQTRLENNVEDYFMTIRLAFNQFMSDENLQYFIENKLTYQDKTGHKAPLVV